MDARRFRPFPAALLAGLAAVSAAAAALRDPFSPLVPLLPEPESAAAAGTLEPTWQGTGGLETAWHDLRERAARGRWPRLGDGPLLRRGDRGEAVTALRARLHVNGDAPPLPPEDPLRYDAGLERAIRELQARLGLEPDGVVGPATRAELDRSPRERMRQIARAVASRRALPADLGPRFVLLNLPAFELEAYERGRPVLRSRVVVGTEDRPTPPLRSEIRLVVTHPRWNVPPRIAREELAPRIREDPAYLERLGYEVLPVAGGGPVDPGGVDWSELGRTLRLRQRPGPANALGSIALRFPNRSSLAFHDTPEPEHFERSRRDRSHGCVRVERALDLARWALAGNGDLAALERAHRSGATAALRLERPVPVYLVDWPVWVDDSGRLQTRAEIYPGRPLRLPVDLLAAEEPRSPLTPDRDPAETVAGIR